MDMKLKPHRIKMLRTERAWSQQHLADVSGISLRTIQRVEKSHSASPETLKSLAACFEVSIPDTLAPQQQSSKVQQSAFKTWSGALNRFQKALGTSAVLMAIVGAMLLTTASTNASNIEVSAEALTVSTDKNNAVYTGSVDVFIPMNELTKVSISLVTKTHKTDERITLTLPGGEFVFSDATLKWEPAGFRITTLKAIYSKTS